MGILRPINPAIVRAVYPPIASGMPWDAPLGGGVVAVPVNPVPATAWDYDGSHYTDAGSGRLSAWLDQSGLGNNATDVAGAAARPVFVSGGGPNGYDAINFALLAGAGTQLSTADIGLTAAVTVIEVVQSPIAGGYIHDGIFINTRALLNNASQLRMYAGAFGPSPAAPVDGAWCVVCTISNGASSKASVNGGAFATGDVGAGASTGYTVGGPNAELGAAFALNGRMARSIGYASALSEANANLVIAYAMTKYGIT